MDQQTRFVATNNLPAITSPETCQMQLAKPSFQVHCGWNFLMFRFFLVLLFVVPTPASADIWTFETPSQNVQCAVGQEASFSDLTCTIIKRSGAPAMPRPTNCKREWGHVFHMRDRGAVKMMCSDGNHSKDGFERAEYGVTGEFGGFTCHSSKSGLKCTNRDGNGFFLSRRRQTIIGHEPEPETAIRQSKEEIILRNIKVETLLSAIGFDPGPVDGLINNEAINAIHRFQNRYDLRQQDHVSDEQLAVLEALAAASENSGGRAGADIATATGGSAEPAPSVATAKLDVPVLEHGTNVDLPTCASSMVSATRAEVRSGPGEKYQAIDHLNKADIVYVFDQRGGWAGIVFKTSQVECTSSRTRKVPYERRGWIHKKHLTDLAG